MNDLNMSEITIDDSFYNRQRYVLGESGMKLMSKASIYLFGVGGLGLEIAKNLILGGVKEIYLDDNRKCSQEDFGTNYYIKECDIDQNKSRAEASFEKLCQLNPYVNVKIPNFTFNSLISPMKDEANGFILNQLRDVSCIIITEGTLKLYGILANFCRENNKKLIISDVIGVFGVIFCDFGASFFTESENDEETVEFFIEDIGNNNSPIVKTLNGDNHGLKNGDLVVFRDIEGMVELNGKECEVSVVSNHEIRIKIDTSGFSKYERNGLCRQIKTKKIIKFETFYDQCLQPSIVNPDFCRLEYSQDLVLLFLSLKSFYQNIGRYPQENDSSEVKQVKEKYYTLAEKTNYDVNKEGEKLIVDLISSSSGQLTAMSAVFGGVVAQEAIKAVTHRFTPIKQWFVLECSQVLGNNLCETVPKTQQPTHWRYESLRKCIGIELLKKLHDLRIFMVGCGAIGCELLKNMAMLGISADHRLMENDTKCNTATVDNKVMESASLAKCSGDITNDDRSPDDDKVKLTLETNSNLELSGDKNVSDRDMGGVIVITDNDWIEKSNLNRQFLFKHNHIKQSKSEVARQSVLEMNPYLRIESHKNLVSSLTEHIYNDKFFENMDICLNALDNLEGRRYMDGRCVITQRPLLESGTMSTKGHVQVILPFLTENYTNVNDPEEIEIPYCTLKSFPGKLEHCVEWAREKFQTTFSQKPVAAIRFFQSFDDKQIPAADIRYSYQDLRIALKFMRSKPITFKTCVEIARRKFEMFYNHTASQLLHTFPIDSKLEDGSLFWQFPKRPPKEIEFDLQDPLHRLFIKSYSILVAKINKIDTLFDEKDQSEITSTDTNHDPWLVINDWLQQIDLPKFVPSNKPIETDEAAKKPTKETSEVIDFEMTNEELSVFVESNKSKEEFICPIEFDKDNDDHIAFMNAVSNLRARMYSIEESDVYSIKKMSGRIIPAIATSTSVIAGLVTIELLKIAKLSKSMQLSAMRNSFINLSMAEFVMSEPGATHLETIWNNNGNQVQYTLWDYWIVHESHTGYTLNNFLDALQKQFCLNANMVLQGNRIIYLNIWPGSRQKLKQKMRSLLIITELDEYVDLMVSYSNPLYGKTNQPEDLKGPRIRFILQK